jgi:hypothetical protein
MTLETTQRLIDSSRASRRRLRGSTLVLLGLSMLLGAIAADGSILGVVGGGAWAWLLPQALILALALVLLHRARRQRELVRLMEQSLEAVQLRAWPTACAGLERILSRPIRFANARAESLLALAVVAESEGAYDASQTIYETLLQEQTADALQLHTARVALAGALLRNGQVTDAVSLIERLERSGMPDSLRAQIELVALFRDVTMGQTDSGVARAEERRRLFREHLSTRAGYGYALLAAAFHRANQPQAARSSWHDATLLVPPEDLLARYQELKPVAGSYPAAENPL